MNKSLFPNSNDADDSNKRNAKNRQQQKLMNDENESGHWRKIMNQQQKCMPIVNYVYDWLNERNMNEDHCYNGKKKLFFFSFMVSFFYYFFKYFFHL